MNHTHIPNPAQLRTLARPAPDCLPCTPGKHCERHAQGLGGCIAGTCSPPAPRPSGVQASGEAQALTRAAQLCDWIAESPHQRGSINGLAAQVRHEIAQLASGVGASAGGRPFQCDATGNWLVRDESRKAFKNRPVCDRCLGFGEVNFRPCEQCQSDAPMSDAPTPNTTTVEAMKEAREVADQFKARQAAELPKCDGCGGTIAQHDRMLRCRCDHTRYCAEWPNCNPPCNIGKRNAGVVVDHHQGPTPSATNASKDRP